MPTPAPTEPPSDPAAPTASPTEGPIAGIGGVGGVDGSTGGGSGGSGDAGLGGSGGPGVLGLWLTAGLVGALGVIFFVFNRRRRRGALVAADPATAAVASRPAPASTPMPPPPPLPAAPAIAEAAVARTVAIMPDTLDTDSHIPRWRRPSVQSARKERRGAEVAHVPVAFTDEQPTGERRRVRYRLVRVVSIPDEILGEEVALLDQGDEVELVRSSGAYRLVRTPYGQEGWVHQMTLETGPPQPDDPTPPDDAGNDPPF